MSRGKQRFPLCRLRPNLATYNSDLVRKYSDSVLNPFRSLWGLISMIRSSNVSRQSSLGFDFERSSLCCEFRALKTIALILLVIKVSTRYTCVLTFINIVQSCLRNRITDLVSLQN